MSLVLGYLTVRQPLPQVECCDGCVCTVYQTTIFYGTTYSLGSDQTQTTRESTITLDNTPSPQAHVTTNSNPSHSNPAMQNALNTQAPNGASTTPPPLTPILPTGGPSSLPSGSSDPAIATSPSSVFDNATPLLSLAADVSPISSASVSIPTEHGRSGPTFNASSGPNRKATNLGVVVGAILGGLFLVALLVSLAAYCARHRKNQSKQAQTLGFLAFGYLRRGDGQIAPFVSEPISQTSKAMPGGSIESFETHINPDLSSKGSLVQYRPLSVADIPPSYVP